MSASLPPLPPDGDVNKGPQLIAIFWVEAGIATVFVALRLYTKLSLRSLGWDDWTMFISWALYVITMALCTVLVHYGLGRHMYFIMKSDTPQNLNEVLRWNWIVQPFGIMILPFVKASIILLLLKLIGPNTFWRKWLLWANFVLFFIVMSLGAIFNYVQCNPPRALWELVPDAVCWDPSVQANYATFGSAYSAFLDFFLALLPVTIVWQLKLSVEKKLGLCLVLGLGVFSGVCACFKTAYARSIGARSDLTWDTYDLFAWSSSEVFLNICCGSVPALKPLYDYYKKGKPMAPKSSSYNSSSGGRSWKLSNVTGSRKSTHVNSTNHTANSTLVTTQSSYHPIKEEGDNSNISVERSFTVDSGRGNQRVRPTDMV